MQIFRKKRPTAFQRADQLDYAGTQALLDGEEGLEGYNRDVVMKLVKGLKFETGSKAESCLLEFGAGTGSLAEIWRSRYNTSPICFEIDPSLAAMLRSKGFDCIDSLDSVEQKVDFVYTSNVLEHIENDLEALLSIKKSIKPGGRLAIYVPALPMLFSDLDRKVGHFRRYKKKELINKVQAAGFTVENCFYSDSIGVLASFALILVGFRNKSGLGSKRSMIFYDRIIYPISKTLDRFVFRNIIGKNLFLFASTCEA
ncbi:MAG: class I SAM-dependent methyltransferase [Actinobacteria bacterium]|nr:class I SAM-dependent methyltransferase [Actinomycetota bacterium]